MLLILRGMGRACVVGGLGIFGFHGDSSLCCVAFFKRGGLAFSKRVFLAFSNQDSDYHYQFWCLIAPKLPLFNFFTTKPSRLPVRTPLGQEVRFVRMSTTKNLGDRIGETHPRALPGFGKLVVSIVLILHFFLIGLVYFSNNSLKRMPWADDLLQQTQLYTIPLGWYTELAPMSLIGSEMYERPVEVSIKSDAQSQVWKEWSGPGRGDARWRRLMQVAGALAINGDEEGLALLGLSLVKQGRRSGMEIERIRLVGKGAGAGGAGAGGAEQEPESLFEATVVALGDGEVTLVPAIEPTRTVPVMSIKGD
jgi:hypothetical protein